MSVVRVFTAHLRFVHKMPALKLFALGVIAVWATCGSMSNDMVVDAKPQTFGICVLATLRYEGPYLLKWLTWHRLVGAHHIFVYLDEDKDRAGSLATDNAELVLAMRSVPWITITSRLDVNWNWEQGYVMKECQRNAIDVVDWVGIWDADEMLAIGPQLPHMPTGGTRAQIPSLVPQLQTYPEEMQVLLLTRIAFHSLNASRLSVDQMSGFTQMCSTQSTGKWMIRTKFGYFHDQIWGSGHSWAGSNKTELARRVRNYDASPPSKIVVQPETRNGKTAIVFKTTVHTGLNDPRTEGRLHHYTDRSFGECLMKENDSLHGLAVFNVRDEAAKHGDSTKRGHPGWRSRSGKCRTSFARPSSACDVDFVLAQYADVVELEMRRLFPRAELINEGQFSALDRRTSSVSGLVSVLDNRKEFAWVHISKAGGINMESIIRKNTMMGIFPKDKSGSYWEQGLNSMIATTNGRQILTMVRGSPRQHLWAMYGECRYDSWGGRVTNNTSFPRQGSASEGFVKWIDHFCEDLNGTRTDSSGRYHCYHPSNYQTRALTSAYSAHGIEHDPMRPNLERALHGLIHSVAWFGVTEFFSASVCLFLGSLSPTTDAVQLHIAEKCRCDVATSPRAYYSHTGHKSSDYTPVMSLSEKHQNCMEKLTNVDRKMSAHAVKLFFQRIIQYEARLGRRVLCDSTLQKQQPIMRFTIPNVTELYYRLQLQLQ